MTDGKQHGAPESHWGTGERAQAAEALQREHVEIEPLDHDNARLLDQVHPHSWTQPTPAPVYNMVVVGAGAGGLVTAAQSAKRGATVALIERGMMGGDCLNIGCVPSKALLACAKRVAAVRSAVEFGVHTSSLKVDFSQIMGRMRRIRADIAAADSIQRFTGPELGVDVFFGDATFTDKSRVTVGGIELHFKKACIATGGRAAIPPIPGLADVAYRTNATIFNLTTLPARLAVIGAGPIGCELAQAFALFGSDVHVYDVAPTPLVREDQDAAAIVIAALERDGVTFHCSTDLSSIATIGSSSQIQFSFRSGDLAVFDEVLVCTGRAPNVEGLGLDAAGVALTKEGRVSINDSLQTTNSNIYAVGDVCMSTQFTHVAGESAQLVVRNALCGDARRWSELAIPWATYTHPEVAHVGKYARELQAAGLTEGKADEPNQFSTFTMPIGVYDRAKCDGDKDGFVRIHVGPGGAILGATIVGAQAGELITSFTVAVQSNGTIGAVEIAKAIVPYPTNAEAIKYCCNQYNIQVWGGWKQLKETWAPKLEAALQHTRAADTEAPQATTSAKSDGNPATCETTALISSAEGQIWTGERDASRSRDASLGFIAGGMCMAAFMMLARRSARF